MAAVTSNLSSSDRSAAAAEHEPVAGGAAWLIWSSAFSSIMRSCSILRLLIVARCYWSFPTTRQPRHGKRSAHRTQLDSYGRDLVRAATPSAVQFVFSLRLVELEPAVLTHGAEQLMLRKSDPLEFE